MWGYEAVARGLGQVGVDAVFSMIGATNVAWIAEGVQRNIFRLVKTRHETAAVAAATGYAQASGAVGVCSVTRGPGFVNAANALVSATRNHIPLLLLVGASPIDHRKNAQQIDQRSLTALLGAGFRHMDDASGIFEVFSEMVELAQWNGQPQVLSLADDVLTGTIPDQEWYQPGPAEPAGPNLDLTAAAVDALLGAQRPLIVAGQGAVLAECRVELQRLSRLTGAALSTTLMANRMFAGHPHDIGLCGGWSPLAARSYIKHADVVLSVGASLNGHTTDGGELFRKAFVIHCDITPDAIGAHLTPDLPVLGDLRRTIPAILAEVQSRVTSHHAPDGPPITMSEVRESILTADLGPGSGEGLDPRVVFAALDQKLARDRIVVTDTGRWMRTLPTLLDAQGPRSFLSSNGFGSIGLGLGTAIGAAVARPQQHVVLFAGDGGFMMAAQDLDAIRLADINLTIVVLNDSQYGSEVQHLQRLGLPLDITRQDTPDLVALARAYGGDGIVVHDEHDLERLELTGSGLVIVDVRIDPELDGQSAVGAASERTAAGRSSPWPVRSGGGTSG